MHLPYWLVTEQWPAPLERGRRGRATRNMRLLANSAVNVQWTRLLSAAAFIASRPAKCRPVLLERILPSLSCPAQDQLTHGVPGRI